MPIRTGYELEIVQQRQSELRNEMARDHQANQYLQTSQTKASPRRSIRHKLGQVLVNLGLWLTPKTETS